MHFVALIGVIIAGVALLISGIMSVWRDLMQRGPLDPPLIPEDGVKRSSRYRDVQLENSTEANDFRATGRR